MDGSGKKRLPTKLKQANLFNLPGVVVVEELRRQNAILNNLESSVGDKTHVLRALLKKKPATDILIETGIGKTVRKLSRSGTEDPEVTKQATKVYVLWKKEVEKRETLKERGPLDVLCDLETQNWREKCREQLASSLKGNTLFGEEIAVAIEKELFDQCKPLQGKSCRYKYSRTARSIYFECKHKQEVRECVLESKISPRQVVEKFLK